MSKRNAEMNASDYDGMTLEEIEKHQRLLEQARERKKYEHQRQIVDDVVKMLLDSGLTKAQFDAIWAEFNPKDDKQAKALGYNYKDQDRKYWIRKSKGKKLTELS